MDRRNDFASMADGLGLNLVLGLVMSIENPGFGIDLGVRTRLTLYCLSVVVAHERKTFPVLTIQTQ